MLCLRALFCDLLICVIGIVQGTLKGHDQLMNLVLDDVQEMLRGTPRPRLPLPPPQFCIISIYSAPADCCWPQMTKAIHPPAPSAS